MNYFSKGYLKRFTQDKSSPIDYVDLDIICDGLFILSCVAELDVHRKVRENIFCHVILCLKNLLSFRKSLVLKA